MFTIELQSRHHYSVPFRSLFTWFFWNQVRKYHKGIVWVALGNVPLFVRN